MKIVTIIENSPITGVRYGTVELSEYNDNIKRRIERHNRFRNELKRAAHMNRTHKK